MLLVEVFETFPRVGLGPNKRTYCGGKLAAASQPDEKRYSLCFRIDHCPSAAFGWLFARPAVVVCIGRPPLNKQTLHTRTSSRATGTMRVYEQRDIHGWWRWALLDGYACVMMPQVCGCRRLPIIIISPTRVTLITTDACSKSLFYSFQTTRVFWMVNQSKNRLESTGAIWDAVTVTEEFGKSYFSSKTRKNSKFRR